MNLKTKFSIVLILIVSSTSIIGTIGIGNSVDLEEDQSTITGLIRPVIDGAIGPSDLNTVVGPSDLVSEWGDVVPQNIKLIDNTGGNIPAQIFTKVVQETFYLSLQLGDEISSPTISKFIFQLDRDNSGDISKGDIRVILMRYGTDIKGISNEEISTELLFQVFVTEWKNIEDMNSYDIPITADWGDIILSTSYNSNYMTGIELSLNLFRIEQDLSYYPSNRVFNEDIQNGQYENLNYAILFKNTDLLFGYPIAPETDEEVVLTYATARYDVIPVLESGPDISVDDIIFMQATQNEVNRAHILRMKDSLVRVVIGQNSGTFLNVRVSIKVYRSLFFTVELIGTNTKDILLSPSPRIQLESGTANFFIPARFLDFEQVIIKAEIELINATIPDYKTANNLKTKSFLLEENNAINIYLLKINSGTIADPIFAEQGVIDEMISVTRALLPTTEINFIWIPNLNYPNNDSGGIKSQLNSRYNELIRARRQTVRAGGIPMPFPHQLIGIRKNGFPDFFIGSIGGSSDPEWGIGGGNSRVAWISVRNSGGSTGLMHEVNHNFGPSSWGHHVTGFEYGCGAPDGLFANDGEWNSLYGDNIIHDLGWFLGTGLISAFTPEIMTYCSADSFPRTWIGEYRWNKWFNYIQSVGGGVASSTIDLDTTDNAIRTISGWISKDGNGYLNPSFKYDTGVVSNLTLPYQNATIQVLYLNQTMVEYPIQIGFNDIDNYLNSSTPFSYFSISIVDNGQIQGIELYDDSNNYLYGRYAMNYQISASLDYPTTVKRNQNFNIDFNIDGNQSEMFIKLLYSPNGMGYYEIPNLSNINLSQLPGGTNANFRILLSDGVSTTAIDGSTIAVDHNNPTVKIQENMLGNSSSIWKLNTTGGNNFGLSVTAQDEFGRNIKAINYMIRDKLSGNIIKTFNIADKMPRFKLPVGDYYIDISVTDPATGLTGTDSIEVQVFPRAKIFKLSDINNFFEKLVALRLNYDKTTTSSNTSDLNSNTSSFITSVTERLSDASTIAPINFLFAPSLIVFPTFMLLKKRIKHNDKLN